MDYRIFSILVTIICLFSCVLTSAAQNTSNTDGTEKPVILYSGTPKKYEIADIKVVGAKNYEDYVIIGLSGLSKGQTITVPGDEITQACKRYWRHGLFSDVQITADKIEGDQIWLTIHLTMRPRVSDIRYHGVKKSEREDLEARVGEQIRAFYYLVFLVGHRSVNQRLYLFDGHVRPHTLRLTDFLRLLKLVERVGLHLFLPDGRVQRTVQRTVIIVKRVV